MSQGEEKEKGKHFKEKSCFHKKKEKHENKELNKIPALEKEAKRKVTSVPF